MNRIRFLYCLLGVFLLLVIAGVCMILLTPEEPSVLDEYDYEEIQNLVEPSDAPCPTQSTCGFPGESIPSATANGTDSVCLFYSYDKLRAINPDFAAWLYIPDTLISLPVVIGPDNSYYLTHSFTGSYSSFGCLYFDINTLGGTENRVIHGHNMGNNREEIFSTLVYYQDQTFAEEHKYLYMSEEQGVTDTYEVFAVLNYNIYSYYEKWNYMSKPFNSDAERDAYIAFLKGLSVYSTDFEPDGDILILSTCNRAYGTSNRLLICAGKVACSAD